ncbi:DUF3622 domain-containing protein [Ferrimonas marina]|uniref:DUF3622 domain-containing protein n=1 Tax=Ferrimonas marina TaxID=299255 RepID=A0A1M5X094_9GAMM|nr:DUF3622 domain-containing protein [Ferrimonas marina]SHH93289.1 Protein of unknown function [Ferrimonas marina]
MAQSKKYDYRVNEKGGVWSAAILRKVTARRTVVSKKQGKFASEAEAVAWAENELKAFLSQQAERNERKAKGRLEREALAAQQAEKAEQKAAAKRLAELAEQEDSEDEDGDDWSFEDGFDGDDDNQR